MMNGIIRLFKGLAEILGPKQRSSIWIGDTWLGIMVLWFDMRTDRLFYEKIS